MRTAGWLPSVSFVYICFPALWRSLMKHRILHEPASLLLEYDVLEGYIHAIWARDQTPATTMAGCERILEYLDRGHWHWRPGSHKAIHGH